MCEIIPIYYSGNQILNTLDIDGNRPEIYIITSNRTGGKTFYFNNFLVKNFLENNEKFGVIYRYAYELEGTGEKFFNELHNIKYPQYIMTSKKRNKGVYQELFIKNVEDENEISCGYAISLNFAEQIKKQSHLLNDISWLIFDEFQSENNRYVENEIQKFISIHTSLARGNGKQVKYLPVIMISNNVSLLNPYYSALGISDKLRDSTKILKGKGYVLERNYNKTAEQAQNNSGFVKAFSNNNYTKFSLENCYLNDNYAFISKPTGKNKYICTIRDDGSEYGIRLYTDDNIMYCDNSFDETFTIKIVKDVNEHTANFTLIRQNYFLVSYLRKYFEQGLFRFKNLRCKNAVLKTLSY